MLKILDVIMFITFLFGIYLLIESYNMNNANAQTIDTEWTESTYKKQDNLVSIGYSKEMAKNIINGCKKSIKDPVLCIKLMASVMGAESSMGKRCYRNNCLGMNDGAVAYISEIEGINSWVTKFDRWWYKQKNPSGFYRNDGIAPITHYCMGKKRNGVCKEGTKNSWNVWNKLDF